MVTHLTFNIGDPIGCTNTPYVNSLSVNCDGKHTWDIMAVAGYLTSLSIEDMKTNADVACADAAIFSSHRAANLRIAFSAGTDTKWSTESILVMIARIRQSHELKTLVLENLPACVDRNIAYAMIAECKRLTSIVIGQSTGGISPEDMEMLINKYNIRSATYNIEYPVLIGFDSPMHSHAIAEHDGVVYVDGNITTITGNDYVQKRMTPEMRSFFEFVKTGREYPPWLNTFYVSYPDALEFAVFYAGNGGNTNFELLTGLFNTRDTRFLFKWYTIFARDVCVYGTVTQTTKQRFADLMKKP